MIERRGGVACALMARATPSSAATPAALSVAPLQMVSAGSLVRQLLAEMVVVRADHHVLVRQVRAGDDGEQVGAAR